NIRLLEAEYAKTSSSLEGVEAELVEIKKEHPGLSVQLGDDYYSALHSLGQDGDALRAEVSRLRLKKEVLGQRLENGDLEAATQLQEMKSLDGPLGKLERAIEKKRSYGLLDNHPELVPLLVERERLQKARRAGLKREVLTQERQSDRNQRKTRAEIKDVEVTLKVTEEQLAQLQIRRAEMQTAFEGLPGAEAEYTRLMRSYRAMQKVEERLFQSLEAERLQLQIELEVARSRSTLLTPVTPIWRSRILQLTKYGFFGGLLFLLGAIGVVVAQALTIYLKKQVSFRESGYLERR
ncbi:MAG: hypothetical protein MK135_07505, partial [Polyangiaceae bacterium]|nr:hypothetical protein [Polyangiaceae bacterium]